MDEKNSFDAGAIVLSQIADSSGAVARGSRESKHRRKSQSQQTSFVKQLQSSWLRPEKSECYRPAHDETTVTRTKRFASLSDCSMRSAISSLALHVVPRAPLPCCALTASGSPERRVLILSAMPNAHLSVPTDRYLEAIAADVTFPRLAAAAAVNGIRDNVD